MCIKRLALLTLCLKMIRAVQSDSVASVSVSTVAELRDAISDAVTIHLTLAETEYVFDSEIEIQTDQDITIESSLGSKIIRDLSVRRTRFFKIGAQGSLTLRGISFENGQVRAKAHVPGLESHLTSHHTCTTVCTLSLLYAHTSLHTFTQITEHPHPHLRTYTHNLKPTPLPPNHLIYPHTPSTLFFFRHCLLPSPTPPPLFPLSLPTSTFLV